MHWQYCNPENSHEPDTGVEFRPFVLTTIIDINRLRINLQVLTSFYKFVYESLYKFVLLQIGRHWSPLHRSRDAILKSECFTTETYLCRFPFKTHQGGMLSLSYFFWSSWNGLWRLRLIDRNQMALSVQVMWSEFHRWHSLPYHSNLNMYRIKSLIKISNKDLLGNANRSN